MVCMLKNSSSDDFESTDSEESIVAQECISPAAEKQRFLCSTTPGRFILRRHSTSASSACTAEYPEPAIAPLEDVQEDASLAWYAESNDTAYMMDGSKRLSEINREMDPSTGYMLFTFENQKTWLSTVPALGKIRDIAKKPAGKDSSKNASAGKDSSKIMYSRAYHCAQRQYKRECLEQGKAIDKQELKTRAREAAQAAVA
eukprot:331178-Lingulodinium_polyedra.AAC.1